MDAKQVGDLTRIFCTVLEVEEAKHVPGFNRLFRTFSRRQRKLAGAQGFIVRLIREQKIIEVIEELLPTAPGDQNAALAPPIATPQYHRLHLRRHRRIPPDPGAEIPKMRLQARRQLRVLLQEEAPGLWTRLQQHQKFRFIISIFIVYFSLLYYNFH